MPELRAARRCRTPFAVFVVAGCMLMGPASASGATWSLVSTPNAAGAEHSALYDMACEPSSTNACTAVGRSVTGGVGAPYAQYWNGTSWANQSAASPAGARDAELRADHCLSTVSCIAVGDYTNEAGILSLAESWNGSSWSIQTTPNPSGATETRLTGVSCSVITACIGVGYGVVSGVRSAIAERGNSGSWSLQTFPIPTGATASELKGVECRSATSCIAVGQYTERGGAYWALAASWNGTTWTLQTVPSPTGARRATFLDISCSDTSNCTGVGAYTNSSSVQVTLAERWNGTSWAVQTTPNPAGSTNSVLQNVWCAERYSCVAVGDWINAGHWVPMAQYWNNVSWSLDTTPNKEGSTFALLEGVACRTTCLAVGWSRDAESRETTLGEVRGTPSWTLRTVPNPTSDSKLDGIGCYTTTACFGVGVSTNVAETYIGTASSWILWESVVPAGAVVSELRDATCSREPITCFTVGFYRREGGSELPYAARWLGERWTIQTVPTPVGATSAVLNDVACASPTSCKAVGSYTTASATLTFVSTWNGTSWSVESSPNVAGATTNALYSVSCTGTSACTAVGLSAGGTEGPVIERWNGTSWSLQTNPTLPLGGISATLYGVSCTTSTACLAVGQYAAGGGQFQAYAASWNGTSWTSLAAPFLSFTTYAYLEDVSCTSSTECIAVGTYTETAGVARALATGWDGTSWTLHNPPNPGTRGTVLRGVACLSSTNCQGVGWKTSGSYENLAESYP